MSLNLAVILEENARSKPEKPALILDNRVLSYAELNEAVKKFANALASIGVKPEDKVALMVPNVPEFVISYYGILNLGATVVPLNVLFKTGEVAYHLEDSDAVALIIWESFFEEAARGYEQVAGCKNLIVIEATGGAKASEGTHSFTELLAVNPPEFDMVQTDPNDTAVLSYTSGTTGKPKGVELTHFNLFYSAVFYAEKRLKLREDDISVAVLPLSHIFGQSGVMNTTIYNGGTIALVSSLQPTVLLKVIQKVGVTILQGVPTLYQLLLWHPDLDRYDTSSLRLGVSGGDSIPVGVLQAFEKRFGIVVLEGYGLSETSSIATYNRSAEQRKIGSVGLPLWGTEAKVVDEEGQEVPRGERGELILRGPNIMKGYYKNPEATEKVIKNGWLHTGDVVTMDDDGFIFIVDRLNDMVVSYGYNVYPREIEEVIYQHPAVAEVAVIGLGSGYMGEDVAAVITLKEGRFATEQEIISFVKERVAIYKCPSCVFFMERLPRTPTGKILKRELRRKLVESR